MIANHINSMKISYMQEISNPPQVNYVATCPMLSTVNEEELLTVFSSYLDLNLTVDMVNHSLGTLKYTLSPIDLSKSLTMYSFQSIVLMYDEDLLEDTMESDE
jgi:hypothetical protein